MWITMAFNLDQSGLEVDQSGLLCGSQWLLLNLDQSRLEVDQSGLLCGSEWPLREQEWLSTWFNASNDWNKKRLPSGCDHGEKVHGGLLCLHEAGVVELLLLLLQLGLLLLLLLQLVLLLLLLLLQLV